MGLRVLYLEGQGDLVSRLIRGITKVTIWIMGIIINLLTKSPQPSKSGDLRGMRWLI